MPVVLTGCGGVFVRLFLVLSVLAGMALAMSSASAETFLGFRLLNLDGRFVSWRTTKSPKIVVSYAFVQQTTEFPTATNCQSMVRLDELVVRSKIDQSEFRSEVQRAFHVWERVANISFHETSDTTSAGILIGSQADPIGHAFADVSYKREGGNTREISRSLICLNPLERWKIGFDGDLSAYDVRYTLAHEIGHAIGLDHPEPDDQLMSFKYRESFRELQAGDVEGATKLYGRRGG